jgi:glycosyltransferase involved in cell wall biosynthesis
MGKKLVMTGDQPLVSVIMNCHNGEKYLREAIDSVYAQTYTNWEIIFWDNTSIDGSDIIAKSYSKKLKYYKSEKKTPLGEARNKALKKAKGRYLSFLDCDDMFLPGKLLKQVCEMQFGNFGMCYGSVYHIDKNGGMIGKRKVLSKKGKILRRLLMNYDINMQTVMIESNLIKRFSLSFDQELEFSPDYDLFMEIAVISNIVSLDGYLSKYRIHCDSLTQKSQHLICKEGLHTLNRLKKKYENVFEKCRLPFKYARSTFKIQEAIACLQSNNVLHARRVLLDEFPVNLKVLILLFLLHIKISPRFILILIGRSK